MEPLPVPAVQFFWSNVMDEGSSYGDSGGEITELQVQQGDANNRCFWGPEFGFAQRLRQLQPASQRVLIVKASRGGGGSSHWCADGHMRAHVISTVSAALAALGRTAGENEVRGKIRREPVATVCALSSRFEMSWHRPLAVPSVRGTSAAVHPGRKRRTGRGTGSRGAAGGASREPEGIVAGCRRNEASRRRHCSLGWAPRYCAVGAGGTLCTAQCGQPLRRQSGSGASDAGARQLALWTAGQAYARPEDGRCADRAGGWRGDAGSQSLIASHRGRNQLPIPTVDRVSAIITYRARSGVCVCVCVCVCVLCWKNPSLAN